MKEVRTKEQIRNGGKLEKGITLADRMRSEAIHAAQQHSRQTDSVSSPNEYADSTARDGLDRVTQEAGHLIIGAQEDIYRMGVNLYRQHQAKKQAAAPSAEGAAEAVHPIQQEPMAYGQGNASAHMSTSLNASAQVTEQLPESMNPVRTRTETVPGHLTQNCAQQRGRQLAQQSFAQSLRKQKQQKLHRYTQGSFESAQGISVNLEQEKTIRTKGSPSDAQNGILPREAKAEVHADSFEEGRKLAKKDARKRMLSGKEKYGKGIVISTEKEYPEMQAVPVTAKSSNIPNPAQSAVALDIKTATTSTGTAEAIHKERLSVKNGVKPTRKRTEKAAGKTIRTIDRGIQEADTVQRKMARSAKKKMEKAIRSEQVKKAGQAVASAASKASKAAAKTAKAIADSAKELAAALTAGSGILLILVMLLVVVGAAGLMFARDDGDGETLPICADVKRYESVIRYYAKQHGIGDYVLLIEAVMMQESNGRTTDPMQCSECGYNTRYPREPGSITDPEYSIDVGIQYLAYCMDLAGVESPIDMDRIKIALQGYNYGDGYITWALNKYGEYTKANAIEFSLKMAEQMGWGGYGDKEYVPHVLRFYPIGQLFYEQDNAAVLVEVAASQVGNVGGEPYWRWYGFTEHVEWCACFVSWCANECGYITSGILPKFAGCVNGVNWFKSRGQWQPGSYEPNPGDIIFFDWNKSGTGQDGIADHVGIVAKVEDGVVYTIEGNTSDRCAERRYRTGHYEILGYGITDY